MRRSRKLGLGTVGALGLTAALVAPALADYGPAPLDTVGVGSDTVQNIGNFVADGFNTLPGYNTAGNKYKMVSFDATGDANDRTVYPNCANATSCSPLKLAVVLRAGTSPVQRPNGSGAGVNALLADTSTPSVINFVRMSRLPKTTEQQTAVTNGWGGLHVVKIATDDLLIAASGSSTNAVPLTAAQLVDVYKCTAGSTDWHAFNSSAPVGSTIIPLVPQSGSGTGDSFRADLKAANGGTDVTLGACVHTVEENDPASITGASTPANAIAPFSSGRKALFDDAPGYFKDPTVPFPGPAGFTSSGIQLLYGTQTAGSCTAPTNPPGAGNTATYCNTRGLFIAWRQSDTTSTTPWQPGSSRNWVQTLFWRAAGDGKSFIQTTGGQADIAAGGASATWVDCGFGTSVTSC